MRIAISFLAALSFVITSGCSSTGAGPGSSAGNSADEAVLASASPANAAPMSASGVKKRPANPDLPMPSKLVHDPSEVPTAVRRIERFIDPKSGILADEVVIEVSKNYQFDCSLTGDRVGHVLAGVQGTDRMALGPATAYVRNLKIRADKRIRLVIADFGTKPFIRITARGRCAHVIEGGGVPKVERADAILIRNDRVQYLEGSQDPAVTAAFAARD
jgi:hypothetical protein